ncbi:MAG: hypothetical protein WA783_16735 [Phormidesmis sp.]
MQLKTEVLQKKTAKRQWYARQVERQSGIALIILAIAIGLVTRILSVFQYVTFDIGPDPDQIRDAFVVMDFWKGNFPTLGPLAYGAGLGGFHIPPLYYYLFFPFTVFGKTPVAQAFPNAFFSFLSIPLFIVLIFRLLKGVHASKRLFLSGLSGFWYSLLFGNIFISNFQWNPSSIPFFFMGFTLLYDVQMKAIASWKVQILTWIGSGIVLSILMSLHSSTLFVMPVVYAIISLNFIFKILREQGINLRMTLPALGGLSAVVALTPYWIGESKNHFGNTKSILRAVLLASESASGSTLGDDKKTFFLSNIVERLGNAALHILNVVRQVYFWNESVLYLVISLVAIALIFAAALVKFKGNRTIWLLWLSTWALLLLAAASLAPGETIFYYRLLVTTAPIVLTAVALAYIELSGPKATAYFLAIAAFVALSCINNLYYDAQFMAAKYGPHRVMNTQEVAQIMEQLPTGANICDPRIARKRSTINQYRYIDIYLAHKQIKAVSECQAGSYVIHPKRILDLSGNFLNAGNYQDTYFIKTDTSSAMKLWPTLKTIENLEITRPASLVMEIQTANVYLLSQ